MDERRLRYFLAIVDEGSVTLAATRQHVAQPSLSQALRGLEAELGVELFHRAGRGLRLSAAGAALVGPARQALAALDGVRDAAAEVATLLAGTLRIAALSTLAVDPLAELIGRFRRQHPGVALHVYEPEGAAAVSILVHDGECELGFAHLPLPREGRLRIRELGSQELRFVLPPDSALAATEGALEPQTLRDIPLVVSPPGTSTRILLERALEAVEVIPRIAVQTAAREAIVPLVLAGAGAALLPDPLAREAERRGALVRSAQPPIVRQIGLVQREGRLSPAGRAFTALIAEQDGAGEKRARVPVARRTSVGGPWGQTHVGPGCPEAEPLAR
jgi:LysR family transcriptional regulator, carnitine catabolism transcriptional activator